ncbi:MAG: restriction endonuclease, partial [Oxalobacteraceae bacterium]|nr:restriction endonuclease [Oxalobacteraceae bacterium]
MAVPPFHEFFPALLRELAKHPEIHIRDLKDLVIASLDASPEDIAERLPGGASRMRNRIGWAVSYLFQAGAIERPS